MSVDVNLLYSIQNTLQFINDNWSMIIIIIGLLLSIAKKAKDYFSKSNDEKIEIAKKHIKETMLKLITDAEIDYIEWTKAGSIKRSQVINKIFESYPILSTATNQEEIIVWIDETINESLSTMRDIFSKNNNVETSVVSNNE